MTLPCPLPGCRLVRVARDGPSALTVLAQARHDHARCPTCRTLSTSVHSRYHRRPTDLPVSGNAVRLQLAVRRFYCRDPACTSTSAFHSTQAVILPAVGPVLPGGETAEVVDLGGRLRRIVRSRGGDARTKPGAIAAFGTWLEEARAYGVRVVASIVARLVRDGAVVSAGLLSPWSTGRADRQVNCLKLPKRFMCG